MAAGHVSENEEKGNYFDSNYKHAQSHAWGPCAVSVSSMRNTCSAPYEHSP